MATSAEKRAWLATDGGHPELAEGKGRLPASLLAEYDAAHAPADDYGPGASPADFDGPLDFVTADDPSAQDLAHDVAADAAARGLYEPAGAAVAEERPSRPHARRPRFSFPGSRVKDKGSPSTRKTFRRVSIAPLIEDAYSDLAWAAAGIPPLRKLLQAQAPIAGVILDPVVQGTVADRVLQPMARNYERMQVATALLGTPMFLMATLATAPEMVMRPMIHEDGTPMLGADGQPVVALVPGNPSTQHQMAMLSLRYGVRAMADVAGGDALGRVQERAEANAARDDQVNQFIAWLLGIPPEAVPEETEAREARDAGLKLAGVGQ